MQQTHVFRLTDGLAICRNPDILDKAVEKLALSLITTKESSGKFEKYYFIKKHEMLFISTNPNILEPLSEKFQCDDLNLISQPYQFQNLQNFIKQVKPVDMVKLTFDKLSEEVQISKHLADSNLYQVLERGQKLNEIETITSELAEGTKNLFGTASKLDRAAFIRKYGTLVTIGGFVILILILKIFW